MLTQKCYTPPAVLLQDLIRRSVIHPIDWQALGGRERTDLVAVSDPHQLLPRLVELGLLTKYQAVRVGAGQTSGLVLGNYRVLDRLGVGGMSVVYLGEHLFRRHPVAVKVLSPSLNHFEQVRQRFEAEIHAMSRLHHPNIVKTLESGFEPGPGPDLPGCQYFVMEFVPGQNLEHYVGEHGPLPIDRACNVVLQMGLALREAHRQKIIHRDLKPSNIQHTADGRIKLLDFGLARNEEFRITTPGTALGSTEYMAPEQFQDATAIDARADVYGLGGVLFWCLTARPPFAAEDNTLAGLLARKTQDPPAARRHVPHLPREIDHLIARMMAADPAERIPTADLAVRALVPFLARTSQGVTPRPSIV